MTLELFVLSIKVVDVYIGNTVVRGIGEVRMNFKALTMKFQLKGRSVQLQGEYTMRDIPLGSKQLQRLERQGEIS